jgi:acyl carrier protein
MPESSKYPDSEDSSDMSSFDLSSAEAIAAGRPVFEKVLRGRVVNEIAGTLGCSERDIDLDEHLIAMGLDSLKLFSMTGKLAEWLNKDLSATLLFKIESINDLVEEMTKFMFDPTDDQK